MSKVIYPPNYVLPNARNLVDIFLAGSIEMGLAPDWQAPLGAQLSELECVRHVFNPRRADFDPSVKQSIDDEYFSNQVNWELDNIEAVPIVFMYLDPATKSPISLAELGYLLGMQRSFAPYDIKQEIIVCCPDGFWRQGNVEIMIEREHARTKSRFVNEKNPTVRMFRDYEESVSFLKQRIWSMHTTRCSAFRYFPFARPSESQREQKLYEGLRGLPIPKDFKPDDKTS